MAREKLEEADRIFFVPLDFRQLRAPGPPGRASRSFSSWPNPNSGRTSSARPGEQGRRILLINGRISENSFKKYEDIRPTRRKILGNVDLFLVQTDEDREKLERLGIGPERLEVAGNLKSEVQLPRFSADELEAFRRGPRDRRPGEGHRRRQHAKGGGRATPQGLRRGAGKEGRPAVHRGPPAYREGRGDRKDCPGTGLHGRPEDPSSVRADDWDVLILDTIGELARFYALSDAAFVGGSLVEWGGHNILEPAYYGKPVFFGPHMQNFARLADSFIRAGGAGIVRTDQELEGMFLLKDPIGLREMGRKANAHLASLGGATDRTILEIERFMEKGL